LIAKRGLSAKFNGHAWRVTGTGVDLTVARLHYIAASDLSPLAIGARRWL
jgi:hypothetical protein